MAPGRFILLMDEVYNAGANADDVDMHKQLAWEGLDSKFELMLKHQNGNAGCTLLSAELSCQSRSHAECISLITYPILGALQLALACPSLTMSTGQVLVIGCQQGTHAAWV